eukprot:tig00001339_g8285.t1
MQPFDEDVMLLVNDSSPDPSLQRLSHFGSVGANVTGAGVNDNNGFLSAIAFTGDAKTTRDVDAQALERLVEHAKNIHSGVVSQLDDDVMLLVNDSSPDPSLQRLSHFGSVGANVTGAGVNDNNGFLSAIAFTGDAKTTRDVDAQALERLVEHAKNIHSGVVSQLDDDVMLLVNDSSPDPSLQRLSHFGSVGANVTGAGVNDNNGFLSAIAFTGDAKTTRDVDAQALERLVEHAKNIHSGVVSQLDDDVMLLVNDSSPDPSLQRLSHFGSVGANVTGAGVNDNNGFLSAIAFTGDAKTTRDVDAQALERLVEHAKNIHSGVVSAETAEEEAMAPFGTESAAELNVEAFEADIDDLVGEAIESPFDL